MATTLIELGRNPVLTGTTTGSHTDDGRPIQTLDVNAVVSLGNVSVTVASDGATGAAVPASAGYIGWNDGGTLRGISVAKPLPVQGDITGNVTATIASFKPAATAASGSTLAMMGIG